MSHGNISNEMYCFEVLNKVFFKKKKRDELFVFSCYQVVFNHGYIRLLPAYFMRIVLFFSLIYR